MKCLVCEGLAYKVFDLPNTKMTGGPLEVEGYPVDYFKCTKCDFLFANHQCTYDDVQYWNVVEPVDDGRVGQTIELFEFAGGDNTKTVLDYGCGKGFSIPAFRNRGVIADGADIYPQKLDHYMQLKDAFEHDIVVACEVVEHFTNPKASFKHACSLARDAFAFQTAYYDGEAGRDWWYLGPANGHTSLYSKRSLEILAEQNNAKKVDIKDNYYGIQAWHF